MTMNHPDSADAGQFAIRDWLALDRAALANERDVLAAGRISLGLLVGGLVLTKLFHTPVTVVVGWACAVSAVVVLASGVKRFLKGRTELTARRYSITRRRNSPLAGS